VLALDDLHWADDASLELLSPLLRQRPRARVLLAFAHRPRQLALGAPAAVVRSITGQADERLELAPLSPAEAEGLLGERVPAALRPDLSRESGGNPFYLGELARHAGSPLDASHTQAAPGDIPAAVSAALDAELAALSPRGTEVARAAAVAGEPFEPELVAAVAELAEAETLAAVDELVRLDLVRPALTPRRFAFRHPIVRRAVYEAAAPGWRIAAHARAAEALERAGASPLARARHVEYSASPGDEAAVEVLAAAGHAAAPRAPAVAAHWYEAALRLLPSAARRRHAGSSCSCRWPRRSAPRGACWRSRSSWRRGRRTARSRASST